MGLSVGVASNSFRASPALIELGKTPDVGLRDKAQSCVTPARDKAYAHTLLFLSGGVLDPDKITFPGTDIRRGTSETGGESSEVSITSLRYPAYSPLIFLSGQFNSINFGTSLTPQEQVETPAYMTYRIIEHLAGLSRCPTEKERAEAAYGEIKTTLETILAVMEGRADQVEIKRLYSSFI